MKVVQDVVSAQITRANVEVVALTDEGAACKMDMCPNKAEFAITSLLFFTNDRGLTGSCTRVYIPCCFQHVVRIVGQEPTRIPVGDTSAVQEELPLVSQPVVEELRNAERLADAMDTFLTKLERGSHESDRPSTGT